MDSLINKIIQHKKIVVIFFILAAIICAGLALTVSVNYNMVDYLPSEAQSTKALEIMKEEFNEPIPNGEVMILDVYIQEVLEYKEKIKGVEGVTSVLWLDDIVNIKEPLEIVDKNIREQYYKDENALFSITVAEGFEQESLDGIYELIKDKDAVSGDFVDTATQQAMAKSESVRAILILFPVIIIILIIATTSWLEPILFLLTIGIAVIINLGTNVFLGEISFVTQAISPILQLAVSLDYAIFLLHRFDFFRKESKDINEAMVKAVKRSFPTILASATTTLFGFMALLFMDFRIGSDLGLNLVKGIFFSFITVVVFLPALTLYFSKWIDKTRHRKLIPSFKNIGKKIYTLRIVAIILVAIIIVPSFLAQKSNDFIYGMGSELSESSRFGKDAVKIKEKFGTSNPLVILVPDDNRVKEELLSKEFNKTPHVTSVISYSHMVSTVIPTEFLTNEVIKQFYSDNYARIVLNTDLESEGEIPFAVVEEIQSTADQYCGEQAFSLGKSVNLYDIKKVVEKDTGVVKLVAVLAIATVLLIAFKSILLPILLLLTIETSIWINLSIPYFAGNSLCYVGYLVISTVQLGATVDYAILVADHYMVNRKKMFKKEALKLTLSETTSSIFTSGSILASAGFCLGIISSDRIISELGILLGRGTLISVAMVIIFLPSILFVFDRLIPLTSLKTNFYKEGEKLE